MLVQPLNFFIKKDENHYRVLAVISVYECSSTEKMTNTDPIYALLAKVLSGNAGEEEVSQLEKWKAESGDHSKDYDDSARAWKATETWLAPGQIQQDKLKIINAVNRDLMEKSRRKKKRSLIYLAAAILAFPIAIATGILFPASFHQESQANCEVSAPRGHISKCVLPDETEVWVNAGSSITYDPSAFMNKKRTIRLDGEAYFKVAKNKRKSFSVQTQLAEVIVTGTSFNVKAFAGSGSFETVLSEGSIELQLGEEYKNQRLQIKPGERVSFKTGGKGINVQKVDERIYSAWRNGEIIFQDATLDDLIKELERIYDVHFKLLDPELGSYRFRGIFSYENDLIDALEKFKVTAHIDYYIKNKEVWLSKN